LTCFFKEAPSDERTAIFLLTVSKSSVISSHILSLLNDYELNKEMGMKGRIRVNTIYNKEQSYDPLVKIINRLNIN